LPKKKIVLDTTICIDLFHGHLLKKTTELPFELLLADVILEELINPPGEYFSRPDFPSQKFPERLSGRFLIFDRVTQSLQQMTYLLSYLLRSTPATC
jgi:hypothetical protein